MSTVLLLVLLIVSRFSGTAIFPADCAIVFGTAVRVRVDERGEVTYTGPGPGILRRVSTAAELYRMGKIQRIFLSGGRGEGRDTSEAEVMRRIAVIGGVREEHIAIEDRSTSTKENLTFTRPMTERCTSIVAISDRYHLARIEFLSILMGWRLRTYPASPHATLPFEIRSVAREVIGILAAPLPL